MGDPPGAYYTNDKESANAMIKRAVDFKENEMTDFVREIGFLMNQQKEDIESAVLNKGPYKLAELFNNFHIPENRWFGSMSNDQKVTHMEKFHKTKMSAQKDVSGTSNGSADQNDSTCVCLSVSLQNSNIPSVPSVVLQSISEKAENLLKREGAITTAPGSHNNRAFMIESHRSTRPHFVQIANNRKVVCDDCPAYKSAKLRAHAVAAAEKAGILKEYVSWLNKFGPLAMNVTSFITFDSAKGTGKKGGKSTTTRRKGGRNSKAPPVDTYVDRPFRGAVGSTVNTQHRPLLACLHSRQDPMQPSWIQPSMMQQSPMQPFLMQPSTMQPELFQQNLSTTPTPVLGTFELHLLQYCPRLVRVCFGCCQTLKPRHSVPNPPHDMTVVSRMQRIFTLPNRGERVSREGNVYFHLRANCIRTKQPFFQPNMVVVPRWVANLLSTQHRILLTEFGVSI